MRLQIELEIGIARRGRAHRPCRALHAPQHPPFHELLQRRRLMAWPRRPNVSARESSPPGPTSPISISPVRMCRRWVRPRDVGGALAASAVLEKICRVPDAVSGVTKRRTGGRPSGSLCFLCRAAGQGPSTRLRSPGLKTRTHVTPVLPVLPVLFLPLVPRATSRAGVVDRHADEKW